MCICFIMDWGDGMDIVRVLVQMYADTACGKGGRRRVLRKMACIAYISGIECCRRNISLENIQRIADAWM